jgi:hypothetical protein
MKYNVFIERVRMIHGEKYEYPVFENHKCTDKITIICPEHGEFEQNLYAHLKGQGCPVCSKHQQLTTEEFIRRAKEVHGDKYDYSKTVYVNKRTKLIITCPIHGDFETLPYNHLNGGNCKKCVNESRKPREKYIKNKVNDLETFITEANKIHNNKYDYSKFKYTGTYNKSIIICHKHGEFEQSPANHLRKHGCPMCARNKKLTVESFIEKANKVHNNKYDYSLVTNINNCNDKITIICPEHGEFQQRIDSHLHGTGCGLCAKNKKLTVEDFIMKARQVHGDKYDYSKVKYVNYLTHVEIICPKHGSFFQAPNNHIRKQNNCPHCQQSKMELEMEKILTDNNINFIKQKRFTWLNRLSLDFYLPEHNIAIECQGGQHFTNKQFFETEYDNFDKRISRDIEKFNKLKENNINLLYLLPNNSTDYTIINQIQEIYTKDNTFINGDDIINYIKKEGL